MVLTWVSADLFDLHTLITSQNKWHSLRLTQCNCCYSSTSHTKLSAQHERLWLWLHLNCSLNPPWHFPFTAALLKKSASSPTSHMWLIAISVKERTASLSAFSKDTSYKSLRAAWLNRGYVQAGRCDGLELYTEAEAAECVSARVHKHHLSAWESHCRLYLN